MNVQEQIRAWIDAHEEELIEDIGKLVQYRSVSDKENGTPEMPYGENCAAVLAEFLEMGEKYGFPVHNAKNRCGTISWNNSGEKTIGFWGHLDVVPEGNGWEYPPFACTRKGNFLIGRGVADNKGSTVGDLYAMRCLRDLKIPLKSNVQLIAGCDEEKGMTDVEYYVENYPVPDFSMVSDCAFPLCYGEKGILEAEIISPVLPEVSEWTGGTAANMVPDASRIVLNTDILPENLPEEITAGMENGKVWIAAKGVSKHAADPAGGVSAVGQLCAYLETSGLLSEKSAKAVSFLKEVCNDFAGENLGIACEDEPSGKLTCVGGLLKLENGRAVLTLNIRYPVTVHSDDFYGNLCKSAQSHDFEARLDRDNAPNYVELDSPLIQGILKVYRQVTGNDQQEPFVMGGGTYARKIPNAVAYGPCYYLEDNSLPLKPGHGSAHTPDEVMHLTVLKKAIEVYAMAVLEVDRLLNQ